MKKLITKIIPLLLLATQTTDYAIAQEGIIPKLIEYDVEVIIFEDAHARYINSEYWHDASDLTDPVTDISDTSKRPEKLSVNEIIKSSFKDIKPAILKKEYKHINYSKEYNVLFYGSWRQTGLDNKKAFEINIEELKNNHKTTSENTLTGNFKLVLARYLHIYAELEYHRNQSEASTEKTASNTQPLEAGLNNITESTVQKNRPYPINIHRRMRSKELHYIDHPLLGMLIQINPVKASAKKATTEETAEKPAAQ